MSKIWLRVFAIYFMSWGIAGMLTFSYILFCWNDSILYFVGGFAFLPIGIGIGVVFKDWLMGK